YSGFAVKRFREGPAWRASGGTTSAPGAVAATAVAGDKAHLVFTAPTSTNSPFTYTVTERTPALTGTPTTLGVSDVSVVSNVSGTVTLEVDGLTTGSTYDFSVTATGSNGSTSAPTAYSSSITATA
ncbi:MAG: fibronectin type III domain-containing protein, partial [Mycobacterium sp.]|nr:fibronectin type III domain-containing protein [Mycobacterium sp.]